MAAAPASARPRRRLALMFLSGAAGLGYQIVWTRQGALWLGHELPAVLAVLGAFFGGLALGAMAIGARIERSPRPERWYAACEIVIGAWALAVLALGEPAARAMAAAVGPEPGADWQWTVAFIGTFVLLLPATGAMGATLPALAAIDRRRGAIAGLYTANTAGAVAGVLLCAFVLLPTWGLARTAACCALLNLLCAALAWRGAGGHAALPTAHRAPDLPASGTRAPLWMLAATGLLGIGFEVLTVRALSQVAENTVYTLAIILALYLIGTALGAAWQARRGGAHSGTQPALLGLALATGLGAVALAFAPVLKDFWQALGTQAGLAPSPAALLGEAGMALLALAAPTFALGVVFTRLCERARTAGHALGPALAVNTAGAALAPPPFGALLIPAVGTGIALSVVFGGYALLAMPAWRPQHGPGAAWLGWTAAVVALACSAVLLPPLRVIDIPDGGWLLSHRSGASADVAVVEDAEGVRWLHIDNRQPEGSSGTAWADGRQALLPLLLQGAPQRALFLGVGSGVTAATAARWPGLQVDAVELLPEVLAATPYFVPPDAGAAPRHIVADARRFVRGGGAPYDVIVADNFHPARSGSGSLYTVEHFTAVQSRLAPGGVFCQWLPLHQMDLDTLRSVVRSFQAVYPEAHAVLATLSLRTPVLGLVGTKGPAAWTRQRLQRALDTAAAGPGSLDLETPLEVMGQLAAGPIAVARFAATAALNTDDHPVVAYRAPLLLHAPHEAPATRLLKLLADLGAQPGDASLPDADQRLRDRLASYRAARDHFLQAGTRVQAIPDPQAMLTQVREPLLQAVRLSADFSPAAEPLLRLADALGPVRAAEAEQLRADLAAARAAAHPALP